MERESDKYLKEFNKLLENYHCEADEEDYRKFESKKLLLKKISEVENSALAVYDTHKMHYLLTCSKFDETLGFKTNYEYQTGPDFFYDLMHPDDFPFALDTIIRSFQYLQELPSYMKSEYKLILDYRLRNSGGFYMRFLQQIVVLELDKKGNIWLILKLFDLISMNDDNQPSQRRLINIKTGEDILFKDTNENSRPRIFTKREIEILGLISQGLDSKNISDRLFISINTVNNHRQNILSKTRSGNISQALLYAKRIGIL